MEQAEKSPILGSKVHLSTLALTTLAMFDLVTTMLLLRAGFAEGNPLFASLLAQFGPLYFTLAKAAFVIGPILILEIARKRRPLTAEIGTWVAFALYAYLYGSHLLQLR